MSERETFQQFIERNPRYKPSPGDYMPEVYSKQVDAFAAYADEQIALKLAEIEEAAAKRVVVGE